MSCVATSSGLLIADGVVMAIPGKLLGVIVIGDGTNAASLVLYDNKSAASGNVLCKVSVKAGDTMQSPNLPDDGIAASNGIYADVTGTGAAFIVLYAPGL